MKHARRLELFEQVKNEYAGFLTSILWRLTGDRELFAEAMQYSLLGIWQHVEKLNGEKASAYIYRIALTANSKAWRNRIGRDGQIGETQIGADEGQQKTTDTELTSVVRRAISQLSARQGRAIVMRYLEQQGYEDIARNLGCSQAGVRSHVSKALAALKGKLANLTDRE
ncbi:MAG: RNA polymerase sigma factor [Planctomycetota bacterium]|jgi:RNA polymerase sigma factor (sigma-70 family)